MTGISNLDLSHDSTFGVIPIPPPPDVILKGFDVPGYLRLVKSISEYEKNELDKAFNGLCKNESRTHQVRELTNSIKTGEINWYNAYKFREITEVALYALRERMLSVEQVATMHILDAALHDLYTHLTMFIFYDSLGEDGEDRQAYHKFMCSRRENEFPDKFIVISYANKQFTALKEYFLWAQNPVRTFHSIF